MGWPRPRHRSQRKIQSTEGSRSLRNWAGHSWIRPAQVIFRHRNVSDLLTWRNPDTQRPLLAASGPSILRFSGILNCRFTVDVGGSCNRRNASRSVWYGDAEFVRKFLHARIVVQKSHGPEPGDQPRKPRVPIFAGRFHVNDTSIAVAKRAVSQC